MYERKSCKGGWRQLILMRQKTEVFANAESSPATSAPHRKGWMMGVPAASRSAAGWPGRAGSQQQDSQIIKAPYFFHHPAHITSSYLLINPPASASQRRRPYSGKTHCQGSRCGYTWRGYMREGIWLMLAKGAEWRGKGRGTKIRAVDYPEYDMFGREL